MRAHILYTGKFPVSRRTETEAEGKVMKAKKKDGNWTAYYDSDTGRYFAEIMYTSREGREQYDYEITKDIYSRLGTFRMTLKMRG